jgi:hypothetical protein
MYPDLEATVEPAPTIVDGAGTWRYAPRGFDTIYAEFVSRHLAYTETE